MTRRRFGILTLGIGLVILLVALLLLFNTNSIWALITLGLSILINTFGLAVLIAKTAGDD